MSAEADRGRGEGARGSPAPLRQVDIERLASGELPDEVVTRILESGQPPARPPRVTKGKKLAPVELTPEEIEALAGGEPISEQLAGRFEEAAKLDMNRKRAAGTRAERPEVTPPGEKRTKR